MVFQKKEKSNRVYKTMFAIYMYAYIYVYYYYYIGDRLMIIS